MDPALQLVERTEERSVKMAPVGDGTSGLGRVETEKAQRQEEQDQFAWHEGNRE